MRRAVDSHLDRVVEVEAPGQEGEVRRSSGLLISDGVVVTTAHGLRYATGAEGVRVRPATSLKEASWIPAVRVVRSADEGFDGCLVLLSEPDEHDREVTSAVPVAHVDLFGGFDARVLGFPKAHRYRVGESQPDQAEYQWDLAEAKGSIVPASALRRGYLTLNITSPVPNPLVFDGVEGSHPQDMAAVSWGGLSGGPVLSAEGLLIGHLKALDDVYAGQVLWVIRATDFGHDPALAPYLPLDWNSDGARPLSSTRTVVVDTLPLRFDAMASIGPDVGPLTLSELLQARNRVVSYVERAEPEARFRQWMESADAVSCGVLAGPGGSGKSRMVDELVRRYRADGWAAGFAEPRRRGHVDGLTVNVADLGQKVLLVVDYADHQVLFVADLLQAALRAPVEQLRVVAIVRQGDRFTAAMNRELPERLGSLVEPVVALEGASLSADERLSHYRVARSAYLERLDLATEPVLGMGDPDTAGEQGNSAPELADCATPLLVHARALHDVLAGVDGEPLNERMTPAAIFDSLLDREAKRYWEPAIGAWVAADLHRRQVYAIATLVGARTAVEAEEIFAVVDSPAMLEPRMRRGLVQALMGDEGEIPLRPVEPDRLGEQLVVRALVDRDRLGPLFAAAPAPHQRSRMLEVLLRMVDSDIDEVAAGTLNALAGLLEERLGELVDQAGSAAEPGAEPEVVIMVRQLSAALRRLDDPALVEQLPRDIRFPESALTGPLAAEVYRLQAEQAERDHDPERLSELLLRQVEATASFGEAEQLLDVTTSVLRTAANAPLSIDDVYLARALTVGSLAQMGVGRLGEAYADASAALAASAEALRVVAADETAYERHMKTTAVFVVAAAAVGERDQVDRVSKETVDLLIEANQWSMVVRAASMRSSWLALLGRGHVAVDELAELRTSTINGATSRLSERDRLALDVALLSALTGAERESEAIDLADQLHGRLRDVDHDSHNPETQVIMAAALVLGAEAIGERDHDRACDMAEQAARIADDLSRNAELAYRALQSLIYMSVAVRLAEAGDPHSAQVYARDSVGMALGGHPGPTRSTVAVWILPFIVRARVQAELGQADSALKGISRAIDEVASIDVPAAFDAGIKLRMLAYELCALEERAEEAEEHSAAVIASLEPIARHDPVEVLPVLTQARFLRVFALDAMDCTDDALIELARTEREAAELLDVTRSDEHLRFLFLCRAFRAVALAELNRNEAAIQAIDRALGMRMPEHLLSFDEEVLAQLKLARRRIEDDGFDPAIGNGGEDMPPNAFDDLAWWAPNRVKLGRLQGKDVSARRYRPIIVLGPQRSRKTTGLVIPTLLEWEGPAIVTSVRDDVVRGSIMERHKRGKTWIFEPTSRLFKGGSALTTWNPVAGCDQWDTAVSRAYAFTEAAKPQNPGMNDAEFWYNQAAQLLQPLLFAAASFGLTMREVSAWARTEERAEVYARLSALGDGVEASNTFRAISDLPYVTRGSVYATLRSVLRVYDGDEVRASSEDGFDVDEFIRGDNTLYLVAPPEVQHELAPIFTALVETVINHAYRHQGRELKLLVLLDEAGNIAKVPNLDTIATTAAGTRIQLVSVFHDVSQMESVYGQSESRNIVNNHSALLVLPGNRDPATIDLVDALLADERAGGSSRGSRISVRMLKPGTGLCFYEHLPHQMIELRSSSHDDELKAKAGVLDPDLVDPVYTWDD